MIKNIPWLYIDNNLSVCIHGHYSNEEWCWLNDTQRENLYWAHIEFLRQAAHRERSGRSQ